MLLSSACPKQKTIPLTCFKHPLLSSIALAPCCSGLSLLWSPLPRSTVALVTRCSNHPLLYFHVSLVTRNSGHNRPFYASFHCRLVETPSGLLGSPPWRFAPCPPLGGLWQFSPVEFCHSLPRLGLGWSRARWLHAARWRFVRNEFPCPQSCLCEGSRTCFGLTIRHYE